MIPMYLLLRRMEHERAQYGRNYRSDWIHGYREGLAVAIRIVKELWEEVRGKVYNNPMGGPRGPKRMVRR